MSKDKLIVGDLVLFRVTNFGLMGGTIKSISGDRIEIDDHSINAPSKESLLRLKAVKDVVFV